MLKCGELIKVVYKLKVKAAHSLSNQPVDGDILQIAWREIAQTRKTETATIAGVQVHIARIVLTGLFGFAGKRLTEERSMQVGRLEDGVTGAQKTRQLSKIA